MHFPELSQHINDNFNKLFSSVICDVMDQMGYWDQDMDPSINPIDPKSIVFGRARTAHAVRVFKIPDKPYGLEMEVIDSLKPGDVLVVNTSECYDSCFWGELLSNAAVGHGAHGIVVDGYARDIKGIIELGFPCFVKGTSPADSLGRIDVLSYDQPIECGGVKVKAGDYIFGDIDGVVVIPKEIVSEVLEKALEKADKEDDVRKELLAGASVKAVFEKYGIL